MKFFYEPFPLFLSGIQVTRRPQGCSDIPSAHNIIRKIRSDRCFDDVVLSAVVNWQSGELKSDSVSNEIDVMAVQGFRPVFISCKTSEIHTEALNELSILRRRFGGGFSRAILVTSGMASKSRAAMRNHAAKLGIELIEWEDLKLDRLISRLRDEDT